MKEKNNKKNKKKVEIFYFFTNKEFNKQIKKRRTLRIEIREPKEATEFNSE